MVRRADYVITSVMKCCDVGAALLHVELFGHGTHFVYKIDNEKHDLILKDYRICAADFSITHVLEIIIRHPNFSWFSLYNNIEEQLTKLECIEDIGKKCDASHMLVHCHRDARNIVDRVHIEYFAGARQDDDKNMICRITLEFPLQ